MVPHNSVFTEALNWSYYLPKNISYKIDWIRFGEDANEHCRYAALIQQNIWNLCIRLLTVYHIRIWPYSSFSKKKKMFLFSFGCRHDMDYGTEQKKQAFDPNPLETVHKRLICQRWLIRHTLFIYLHCLFFFNNLIYPRRNGFFQFPFAFYKPCTVCFFFIPPFDPISTNYVCTHTHFKRTYQGKPQICLCFCFFVVLFLTNSNFFFLCLSLFFVSINRFGLTFQIGLQISI